MKKFLFYLAFSYSTILVTYSQNMVFSKTGNERNYPYGYLDFSLDQNRFVKGIHVSPVEYYKMPYRFLSPAKIDSTKKYPLFIMLHGGGEGIGMPCDKEQGENVCQLGWGGKILLDSAAKYPTYALFPQTYGGYWGNAAGQDYEYEDIPEAPMRCVIEIVENLLKTSNIDPDRIYLAGLSNGGKAAWELVERRPDLFASVSPFSGMGNPNLASKIVNNPIWNFQGGKDNNPNPFETERLYDSLVKVGGNPKRSLYEDRDHYSWVDAYQSKSWLGWVYQQNKKNIHILYGKPAEIKDASGLDIGISYGYKKYQWKKDGIAVPGANSPIYNATTKGKYTVSYTRVDGSDGESNVLDLGGNPAINLPPIAKAGPDIKDTLPTKSIVLRGEGTDSDGTISSYNWSKISGPAIVLNGINSSILTLNNPTEGRYTFKFTVRDNNGAFGNDTVNILVVNKTTSTVKKPATISFGPMSFVYDSTPKSASATVKDSNKIIPGISVIFTYNNSSKAPVKAGTYTVFAKIVDSTYQGQAYGTLTITKKVGVVTLVKNSGTYTGKPFLDSAVTSPVNLKVKIFYNGDTIAPVNAGGYSVEAIIADSNYQGRSVARLNIAKALAKVKIDTVTFLYDGKPKSSTAKTTPAGLNVSLTYNKSATAPSKVGSYAVEGTITDMNYNGSGQSRLIITSITALENNIIEGIKIFPNPTSDLLQIQFSSNSIKRIRIINMAGVIVLEKNTNNSSEEILDIRNLQKGVYNVIIESKEGKENVYKVMVN